MPLYRARIDSILADVAHRTSPLSQKPWLMTQLWDNLAFMHWPVPTEVLRRVVPEPLELDLHEGQGWIGVVPFWIPDESLRGRVKVPLAGSFVELNVRTYVTMEGKGGVYFISLDASNHVAVLAARFLYTLPYYFAKMNFDMDNDGWIHYRSVRRHGGSPPADFKASYRPVGAPLPYDPNSIERWLSERYALYTVDDGHVYRGDIHHPIWTLHAAEARIESNTMTTVAGIDLPPTAPLLHYSPRQETIIWPLTPLK